MPENQQGQFMAAKVGTRVRLLPFEGEGEEYGIVLGGEADVVTVRLDERYRNVHDDGLREVTPDQIAEVQP
jgi:tripartite-type tricarboxylate transporter receptor subunit TctC